MATSLQFGKIFGYDNVVATMFVITTHTFHLVKSGFTGKHILLFSTANPNSGMC